MGGCASTPTRDEYCDPGDLPRAAGERISRRTRPAPSPDLRAQPGGEDQPTSPEAGLDVRARIAARMERLRSADDRQRGDPEIATAAQKPADAQQYSRRRRAGSSRRSRHSSHSGARPGGGSSIGTFQTAQLDLEDAIWADDLGSDDDGGEAEDDGDHHGAPKNRAAYSPVTDGSRTGETRALGYAERARRSEEEQSDSDLDDSTSAVSDDPPTGRGRRSVRMESMTRYRHGETGTRHTRRAASD